MIDPRPLRLLLCTLALACAALSAPPARAQTVTCSVSFSTLAFPINLDVLQNVNVDSAGTLNASCSGIPSGYTARMCFALNNGTYGAGGGWRRMGSGTNRLNFQIYTDASYSTVWATRSSSQVMVDLTSGSPSQTLPLYGRVPSGQQSVPPGSYSTTITATVTGNLFPGTPTLNCGRLSAFTTQTFQVTATVIPSCLVSATPLNFGSASLFVSNIDAQNAVSVTCTNGTPYQVRLDGGLAGATNPAARKMTLGANQITYGLYRNAARTQPWGSSDGIDTSGGTGTASPIAHTVYGRIPPQPTPPTGTYTDTVIAVVSF